MNKFAKVRGHNRLVYDEKRNKLIVKKNRIKKSHLIIIAILIALSVIYLEYRRLVSEISHISQSNETRVARAINYQVDDKRASSASSAPKSDILEQPEILKHEIKGLNLNENQKIVANKIIELAKKENFKWTPYLLKLAYCESRLGEVQININSNGAGKDRGVFQINDYWHKDISDAQAYDLEFATKWTMNMINKGYQHRWACDKLVLKQNNKVEILAINK